jgi:ribonuclease G
MTRKTVLIDVAPGETRIAFLEDGRLAEVTFERALPDEDGPAAPRRADSHLGNIHLGRVKRVQLGMQAAFVDIGQARNGFLSARDARRLRDYLGGTDPRPEPPPINTLVHEGEDLLVQVIKDPIGEKGARVSAAPTLPGRLLILVPGQTVFALSRRILDEAERARLQSLIEEIGAAVELRHGMKFGFIMRTAAIGADRAALAEDAERLATRWRSLAELAARSKAPALIHRDLGVIARVLRDHVDTDTGDVVINDAAALAEAKCYASDVMPALAGRLVYHGEAEALFERYGVEAELEGLLTPRVALPSGGWITIESTEALTAIDVNSGSLETGCLEETGYRTNLAAATEIGRQLRLRGIGGLIVIDFIHMAEPGHVEAVLEALRGALALDRAPMQMTGMSVFGLVELTRKRVREPLSRLLTENCLPCGGQARIPTPATVAATMLRRLCVEARGARGARVFRIRTETAVAAWLEARRRIVIEPLQTRLGGRIEIEAATDLARDRFEILTS